MAAALLVTVGVFSPMNILLQHNIAKRMFISENTSAASKVHTYVNPTIQANAQLHKGVPFV